MTELTAASAAPRRSRFAAFWSLVNDPWTPALLRLASALEVGRLIVTAPDGARHCFTGRSAAPDGVHLQTAELILHSPAAARGLLLGGPVGFAEAYIDGDWRSPDLPALLELAARNEKALPLDGWGRMAAQAINGVVHRLRDNTRRGSRRNIAFHYDLGNDFYQRWLDVGMQYSSALYRRPDQTLEAAQEEKLRRAAALLDVRPGDAVLEIGCGWGALAERLIRGYDANVVGLTLSAEQKAWAEQRLMLERAAGKADIRLQDYRDVAGSFDRIASIEMIEAVGQARWPLYFRALRDRLKPGGAAVVQAIVIADDRFPAYRREVDFIQRHVFPGGMLPCPSEMEKQAQAAGLIVDHVEMFGDSYARTLMEWRRRFHAAWPALAGGKFDDRFRRLWDYYLAYCEGGFRAGVIDVGFWRFRRPETGAAPETGADR